MAKVAGTKERDVILHGGPMNGWVVKHDAPALQPDWPSLPGHAGHYEMDGEDADRQLPKAKWVAAPESEHPGQREAAEALEALVQAVAPFTGNFVDLDSFVGNDVVYNPVDVHGKKREFAFPADPPFPLVLAFTKAHDAMHEALVALTKAKAEPIAQARRDAYERAWNTTVEAFATLVEIRTPDLGVREHLREAHPDLMEGAAGGRDAIPALRAAHANDHVAREEHPHSIGGEYIGHAFGPNVLDNWMRIAIFRFNESAIARFIQGLYGDQSESSPKASRAERRAKTRKGRRSSSG